VTGRAWWKKWWVIAIGALLVLFVLAGIFGGGDDDTDSADSPTTDTTEVTATVLPAPTDGASTTDAAVTTEAPTTTEAPPTTPAPTVPPTTAPPVVIQGQGDSVQEITIPDGGQTGIATLTHSGSSNFAVFALDTGLAQIGLLVIQIGPYQGSVLLPEGTTALEITADGAWTVEVKQIAAAQSWEGSVSGRGDNVLVYTGDTGIADITHVGDSNFAVFSYPLSGDGFPDLLIIEIGAYTGSVRFPGPALIEIKADDDWTITVN
jgi:hypothetical protein